MTGVLCFTSINFGYLDRARVLGQTLKEKHPEWTFVLGLTDKLPPGFVFDIDNEPFDRLVTIDDLGIDDLEAWAFKHDVVELGGFNRSSQHSNHGGVHGTTCGMDAGVDGARSNALARCTVASS